MSVSKKLTSWLANYLSFISCFWRFTGLVATLLYTLNIQYTYIVKKYIIYFSFLYSWAFETDRKVSLWQACLFWFVSQKVQIYKLHEQCMYIVFLLQCQKVQYTAKLSEKSRNKLHSNPFQWCPLWLLWYRYMYFYCGSTWIWIGYQKKCNFVK